jgi:endonuclease/exonuclease/phosphatase family metal-dependent hydrolase
MRMATYNIRHAEGMDGRVDLARIAHVIGILKADVIALQELDRGWERSGGVDQVVELERMTGLSLFFYPTVVRDDGAQYGIAVATPEPIDASYELLPRVGKEEPRGLIWVGAPGVKVMATHLSRSRRARAAQTERLAEAAGSVFPVVLLGDLNQGGRHLKPLHDAGLDGGAATLPTLPSTHPRRQVDHVLAGGGARVTQAWTPRTTASDHVPLVAIVEMP